MHIISALTPNGSQISNSPQGGTSAGAGQTSGLSPLQRDVTTIGELNIGEAVEQAASLKYRKSEKTTLFIQTQEGDVVRLKFSARNSFNVETDFGEEGERELSLTARSASKLSIKVRGDLNADELAAIQSTVDQAMNVADDFFSGDLQAAFESASALDVDAEQLARVRLKMRMRERFSYAPMPVATLPMMPSVPEPEAMPDRMVGSVPSPSLTVPSPMPVASPDAASDEGPSVGADDVPTDVAPEVGEESGPTERSNPFEAIGNFLSRILDMFGSGQGRLDMSLKIRVVKSTVMALAEAKAAEGETEMSKLVADTLDALADAEQPALDKVA